MKVITQLKDYQIESTKWLLERKFGMLLHEAGLGKTLIMLDYLTRTNNKLTLIVCPAFLISVWLNEIKNHTDIKSDVIQVLTSKIEVISSSVLLCFISYTNINKTIEIKNGIVSFKKNSIFEKITLSNVILDEAHYIKNYKSKTFKAVNQLKSKFRWILTATPIQNCSDDLYSYLKFFGIVNSLDEFHEHLSNSELKKLVNTISLRYTKENVLDLPSKKVIYLFIDFTETERKLYDALLSYFRVNINPKSTNIFTFILRLRQACNNINVVIDSIPKIKNLRSIDDIISVLNGKQSKQSGYRKEITNLAKMKKLISLLIEINNRNEKCIVVSQWIDTLNLAAKEVSMKIGLNYKMLIGNIPIVERNKIICNFQNEEFVRVLFVSLHSTAEGITLTKANNCIILDDWWNDTKTSQISDRIHRISQTKSVKIYHIRIKNTIEQNIRELVEQKKSLADNIIDR